MKSNKSIKNRISHMRKEPSPRISIHPCLRICWNNIGPLLAFQSMAKMRNKKEIQTEKVYGRFNLRYVKKNWLNRDRMKPRDFHRTDSGFWTVLYVDAWQ